MSLKLTNTNIKVINDFFITEQNRKPGEKPTHYLVRRGPSKNMDLLYVNASEKGYIKLKLSEIIVESTRSVTSAATFQERLTVLKRKVYDKSKKWKNLNCIIRLFYNIFKGIEKEIQLEQAALKEAEEKLKTFTKDQRLDNATVAGFTPSSPPWRVNKENLPEKSVKILEKKSLLISNHLPVCGRIEIQPHPILFGSYALPHRDEISKFTDDQMLPKLKRDVMPVIRSVNFMKYDKISEREELVEQILSMLKGPTAKHFIGLQACSLAIYNQLRRALADTQYTIHWPDKTSTNSTPFIYNMFLLTLERVHVTAYKTEITKKIVDATFIIKSSRKAIRFINTLAPSRGGTSDLIRYLQTIYPVNMRTPIVLIGNMNCRSAKLSLLLQSWSKIAGCTHECLTTGYISHLSLKKCAVDYQQIHIISPADMDFPSALVTNSDAIFNPIDQSIPSRQSHGGPLTSPDIPKDFGKILDETRRQFQEYL